MRAPLAMPLGEDRFRPGAITRALSGRTVEAVMTDDRERMVIRCTDGHELVIVWTSDGPMLERVDVRIRLEPLPPLFATAGSF